MKILVTGTAGFIGFHVVNKLIEGLNLKISDIGIAHRVGKEKRPGKKQIIVKIRILNDKRTNVPKNII